MHTQVFTKEMGRAHFTFTYRIIEKSPRIFFFVRFHTCAVMWKWTNLHTSMHIHTNTYLYRHKHTPAHTACVLLLQESGGRCQVCLWSISDCAHKLPSPPFLSLLHSTHLSPWSLYSMLQYYLSLPSSSLSSSCVGPLSYSFFPPLFSQPTDLWLSFLIHLVSFSTFVPTFFFFFLLVTILFQVTPSCFCASNSYSLLCFPNSPTINYAQTQCTSLCSLCQIIQFTLAILCILNDECIDYTIKQDYASRHSKSFCRHSAQIRSSTNI